MIVSFLLMLLEAGEPVPSKKEWIQKLLAKPGDKAMHA